MLYKTRQIKFKAWDKERGALVPVWAVFLGEDFDTGEKVATGVQVEDTRRETSNFVIDLARPNFVLYEEI